MTARERDLIELELLRKRLFEEKEHDLLEKLSICQRELVLKCCTCGHKKVVAQVCKKRWCPCCARRLAAARAVELGFIVERMQWPLFVTLTMRHSSKVTPADVRKILRCFGKFRRRRIWTAKTLGGVASVELTSDAGNWHPHIHAVIDCEWLAIKAPQPRRRATHEEWEAACKAAAQELGAAWAKQIGQQTASVKIKRANPKTIAKEVLKYTVKAEDLIRYDGSAGDLIRSIEKTRTLLTFGVAHGKKTKDIRKESKAFAAEKKREFMEAKAHLDCCPAVEFVPEFLAENPRYHQRIQEHRRQDGHLRALAAARANQ